MNIYIKPAISTGSLGQSGLYPSDLDIEGRGPIRDLTHSRELTSSFVCLRRTRQNGFTILDDEETMATEYCSFDTLKTFLVSGKTLLHHEVDFCCSTARIRHGRLRLSTTSDSTTFSTKCLGNRGSSRDSDCASSTSFSGGRRRIDSSLLWCGRKFLHMRSIVFVANVSFSHHAALMHRFDFFWHLTRLCSYLYHL